MILNRTKLYRTKNRTKDLVRILVRFSLVRLKSVIGLSLIFFEKQLVRVLVRFTNLENFRYCSLL